MSQGSNHSSPDKSFELVLPKSSSITRRVTSRGSTIDPPDCMRNPQVGESGTSAFHASLLDAMPRLPSARGEVKEHSWGSLFSDAYLDWIFLLLLIVVDVGLSLLPTFERYISKDMLEGITYPLKGNSVPTPAVPVLGFVIPLAMLIAFWLFQRDKADFHQAVLSFLYTMAITIAVTTGFKAGVGRPRPDFFIRCFPDGIGKYAADGNVLCNGIPSTVEEGRKSFPSGHTSWSFAGLTFVALYIAGKLGAFNYKGQLHKVVVVGLPLAGATAVAVTRVDDYWHHTTDVLAGAFIGKGT
eukprot:TRINITY_DN3788_c0_g1_i1.p1 TRINITY_DN3788_c0_g1~~TRINITY_DN3788_c0_g1_i1.p1  ORF type:complete len:298 (-),score=28.83 TRINITY_DN3788_c0_g1_i1:37-930(-)